jgi:hypothetical protein
MTKAGDITPLLTEPLLFDFDVAGLLLWPFLSDRVPAGRCRTAP